MIYHFMFYTFDELFSFGIEGVKLFVNCHKKT